MKRKRFKEDTPVHTHPVFKNYGATRDGRVISLRQKRRPYAIEISPCPAGKGYRKFTAAHDGELHHAYIHRFIYECFDYSIPEGLEVNHINGIKSDNRLSNLELVTSSENKIHAVENGLAFTGEKNGGSKLRWQEAAEIKRLVSARVVSQAFIAKMFMVDPMTVSRITNDQLWKHLVYLHHRGIWTHPVNGGKND